MRISIHATIENEDGASPSHEIQVGEITRDPGVDPASCLGLFVLEAHPLLQRIQGVVLNEQADEFIRIAAGCLACGRRLGIKDTKSLVYRTAYGKALLRSRASTHDVAHAALCRAMGPRSPLWRTR